MKRFLIYCVLLITAASSVFAQQNHMPKIFVQLGHSSYVTSLVYSSDGKYLLSASDDKTMKLWDAETGREIKTMTGSAEDINTIAISPEVKYAVSTGYSRIINIWNIENGNKTDTIEIEDASFSSDIAYSPDGKYIAVGGTQAGLYTVFIFNMASKELVRILNGHQDEIRSVAFSRDGKYLVSVSGGWESPLSDGGVAEKSKDNSVRLWEVSTGRELKIFTGHTSPVYAVSFSLDGKKIYSAGYDSTVRIWDIRTGKNEYRFKGNGIFKTLTVSPDGTTLAAAGYPSVLYIWDISSRRTLASGIAGDNNEWHDFRSITFSPDGRRLALCSDKQIFICNRNLEILQALGGKVLTPELVYYYGNKISLYFNENQKAVYDLTTGRLSDQNEYYFHRIRSGTAMVKDRLIDLRTEKTLQIFSDNFKYGLIYSPYGPYAVDIATMSVLRLPDFSMFTKLSGTIYRYLSEEKAAFAPNNRYFAAMTNDEREIIGIWDIQTGQLLWTLTGHTSFIQALVFTPDSRYLISSGMDRTIKIWNMATGGEERTLEGSMDVVEPLTVSEDGRYLLSGCWDGSIKLWEIATGNNLHTLYGHGNWINTLCIAPNNAYALSGSRDGTTRLWDLKAGKELAQFVHFKEGEWIVITPEGYYNSSAKGDQYLNIRVGNQVYGVDQYRSVFYKPLLVETAIISGKTGYSALQNSGQSGWMDFKSIEPPFVVIKNPEDGTTINADKGELSVYVEDRNQTIKKVTVFINGRTAAVAETRGMKAIQDAIDISDGKKSHDLKFPVTFDPGENLIEVTAFNGFTEGRKSIRIISDEKKAIGNTESILPNLWILSIGVNAYQDKNLKSLSYAVADAAGIVEAFKAQTGRLYQSVKSLIISDQSAVRPTYENIIDNLNYLKKAGANDVAVLFIAGHGLNDDGGEFYFLPNDAVLLDDGSVKRSRAISWREIKSILDFPGKKIVFVDACHSEGVSGKKTRGIDTDRFVKELQDANAVIFTSSRGRELSQEAAQWGHGAFTYSIIEGLKGGANLIKDNKISMKELDAYVSETVPRITNGAQHPITYTPDGYVNFPVAIIE